MRTVASAAAVVVAVALVACGQPQVSLDPGPREYVPADYERVLSRWTRTEHLFALSALDELLTVTATYESWDYRWAYVVRYAQDYRLSTEQRRSLLDQALAETRDHHEFFIALYGTNRRSTDLAKPTSAWIVRLVDDRGGETAPESITAIARPTALDRAYHPYLTVWRQAFRIRFPATSGGQPTLTPGARWVGLRFAGAEGREELGWNLAAPVTPAD